MPSLEIIGGASFSIFASKALPTIPGLLALGIFGTGNDGINSNRAVGGPAFTVDGAAPAYSANFATVGVNGPPATAHATISGGVVNSLTVDTGGANYALTPSVVFSGGGGTGASATAVVSGGVITGFTSLVGGSGYTSAPTITFDHPPGSAINTNIVRTSALVTAGWTWLAVARVPASGLPSTVISDVGPDSAGFTLNMVVQNVDSGNSNQPTLLINQSSGGFVITSTMASAATNFKCLALTYAGGGAAALTAYNLTDAINPAPVTSAAISASNSRVVKIGYEGGTNSSGQADVAAAMIASGALNLTALQGIYGSLKAQLAQRGIAC